MRMVSAEEDKIRQAVKAAIRGKSSLEVELESRITHPTQDQRNRAAALKENVESKSIKMSSL